MSIRVNFSGEVVGIDKRINEETKIPFFIHDVYQKEGGKLVKVLLAFSTSKATVWENLSADVSGDKYGVKVRLTKESINSLEILQKNSESESN